MANENFEGQDFDSAPRFEGQDFDALVAQHQPSAQSLEGQDFDSAPRFEGQDFDTLVKQQQRPEPEGPFMSGVREAAHAVIPGIIGAAAVPFGVAAGTAALPVAGSLVGGAGAFIGGSMAGEYVQDKALKAIGFDDDIQRTVNREANPNSSFFGGMAGAMTTMSPVAAGETLAKRLMQRGAGAAAMGGFEAGSEALQGEDLDPKRIGMSMAAGAVAPGVNKFGERVQGATERFVPGRPGRTADPAAAQTHTDVGDAAYNQEQARYADALADPEAMRQFAYEEGLTEAEAREVAQANHGLPKQATTGNPQSAPTRSERTYPKGERATATENDMLTQGDMDPATLSALNQSLELNALQNEHPTAKLPTGQPEESLPIKTGIEEAAAANPKAADNVFSRLGGEERTPVEAPRVETGIEEAGAGPKFEGQDFDSLVAQQSKVAPAAEVAPRESGREIKGEPHPEPSPAQIEANNFKKGRTRFAGREVAIETAEGGVRRSKPDAPEPWEVKMPYDYGDIKGTKGADGDPVDIGFGKGNKHFVIDQRDANTGKFDEHKVMADFKSEADAFTAYRRGFSDNRGRDRMMHITEVSENEIKDWLANGDMSKPFKGSLLGGEGRGTPGRPLAAEKPPPKVVTATVNALRETGDPAHAKVADAIEAMPREKQVVEATRASAALTNRTGKVPTGELTNQRIRPKPPTLQVGDTEVTGRTLADVERKKTALQSTIDAYNNHPPTEGENHLGLQQRLTTALEKVDTSYKPRVPPKEWLWAREAKRFLDGTMTEAQADKFIANEKLLRSGNAEDVDIVRGTNRIDADIAMSRRSGEEAVSNAENENAAKGRFDIPHEEAESMVEPVPVKSFEDLVKLNDKTLDLTKPVDATVAAIDTDKISRNIISQADKRLAAEAREKTDTQLARAREAFSLVSREPKESAPVSEGAASPVRKIAIDDPAELQRILDAANKAQNKGKGLDALPAEKDPTKPTPKVKDLFDKFARDDSGSLNHKKIANDFRARHRDLRVTLEKYFGTPVGEVGRKVDAVLARSVSTTDKMMAEKAHELDQRWYTWMETTSPAEQLTYLKAIELSKSTDHAGLKADLEKAGISNNKSSWMADEAIFHRELMDNIWLEDAKHGSTAEYIERYVPHIFKDSKGAQDFIEARIKTLGATWYQKERVFDLLDAALKQGFKMKFENPIDLIHARWAASIKSNMLVATARGLHNDGLAFPVKDAPDFVKRAWTFKRLLPDHQQWVFAPGTESLWKNAMEPKGLGELEGPIGGTFRGWMQLKRIWAPIQLAFSAFHELHVAANINPAQNIARAIKLAVHDFKTKDTLNATKATLGHAWDATKWSLQDPILALPIDKIKGIGKFLDGPNGRFSNFEGRRAMENWKTPLDRLSSEDRMWVRLEEEGGHSPYQSVEDVIGAKRDFAKALNDKSLAMIPQGLRRGIEKLQEPMFKYQIPALKNVAYRRNVAAALKMDPELATNHVKRGNVLREISKDIDDRFGEMFYKSLFWNKAVKDAGIGSMLSLSWNLGQLRQVAGAAKNIAGTGSRLLGYQGKPMAEAKFHASDKATFVGAYVGFSMLSAGALSYMLTGELPTGLDYVFPKNGLKNADGSPQRLSTPFNTREPFMLKAHAEQHNSWVGGAMEFLWNKMVLSPLVEIAQNKDFFGNKLYDPNTSWYKKGLQTLDSTAGRMFNPISLSGADRAEKLGGGAKEKALAYAGFNPAPKYVNATPLENHINHLFSDEGTPYSKPYEYGPKTGLGRGLVQGAARWAAGDKLKTEAKQEGRASLDQAGIRGDPEAAMAARRELIEKGGMSARTVSKMRPDQEFQYKFARLPQESQLALAREMTPAEFNKFVILNTNPGLQRVTKAQLLKERSTGGSLPSR